jgi:hypothetical protein
MKIGADLIAACGMNCAICMAYLRKANHCPGCRRGDGQKGSYRMRCEIRNCPDIQESKSGFCFDCGRLPCARLKQLDKRYRAKYNMSMLENLELIKSQGLSSFIEKEEIRWRCSKCGGIICVHHKCCFACKEVAGAK